MTPLDPALTEPLRNPQTMLAALDFAGVAVFAATGAEGYDDILLASLLTPQLSSVRVPKYDLGASAARLLFERMSGKGDHAEIVLLPELVVRRSSP